MSIIFQRGRSTTNQSFDFTARPVPQIFPGWELSPLDPWHTPKIRHRWHVVWQVICDICGDIRKLTKNVGETPTHKRGFRQHTNVHFINSGLNID